jgi:hypothetical protein
MRRPISRVSLSNRTSAASRTAAAASAPAITSVDRPEVRAQLLGQERAFLGLPGRDHLAQPVSQLAEALDAGADGG